MPDSEHDDVSDYVADYLDSVESGAPLPDKARLSEEQLREADAILSILGDPLDGTEEVDVAPIEESSFAIARGMVRTPPAVIVDGSAVRREREGAGVSVDDVARAMSSAGFTTDDARILAMEGYITTALSAREARRLAAIFGVDVRIIETRCEPWPASEQAEFDAIAGAVSSVRFGDRLALVAETDVWLGIVRCYGSDDSLDSLTVRRAVADLLHGEWSEMHGVVVVSAATPNPVVVLDAFDCDARFGLPNGDWGFAYVEPTTSVAAAIADFTLRFGIEWQEPAAYAMTDEVDWNNLIDVIHVDVAIANASRNLNRLHEPKRAGVREALDALRAVSAPHLNDVARDLVDADTAEAAALIDSLIGVG